MEAEAALRSDLQALLNRWSSGALDEEGVRDEAEWICEVVPRDYLGDDPTPEAQVCEQLELMHLQLLTRDDIPEMQLLLGAADGSEGEARDRWNAYWDDVDYRARAAALLDSAFYAPGAESVLATSDDPNGRNIISRWTQRIGGIVVAIVVTIALALVVRRLRR
jgi:hypothetical protein